VLYSLSPGVLRSGICIPYDVGFEAENQFLIACGFTGIGEDDEVNAPFVLVNAWTSELEGITPG
jgi:hypothetical protein